MELIGIFFVGLRPSGRWQASRRRSGPMTPLARSFSSSPRQGSASSVLRPDASSRKDRRPCGGRTRRVRAPLPSTCDGGAGRCLLRAVRLHRGLRKENRRSPRPPAVVSGAPTPRRRDCTSSSTSSSLPQRSLWHCTRRMSPLSFAARAPALGRSALLLASGVGVWLAYLALSPLAALEAARRLVGRPKREALSA